MSYPNRINLKPTLGAKPTTMKRKAMSRRKKPWKLRRKSAVTPPKIKIPTLTEEQLYALDQLVSGLPRAAFKYFNQNGRPSNEFGMHNTSLKGNVGRLFVTGNKMFDCNNWVAGSKKAHNMIRKLIHGQNDLKYLGSSPDEGKLYFAPENAEFNQIIAPGDTAYNDSEYLLLNALSFALDLHGVTSGTAYLLTERIPCDSCTAVINRFLKRYPTFKLEIFYLFDSPHRSHEGFFAADQYFPDGPLDTSRVTLYFCQILPSRAGPEKVDVALVEIDRNTRTMSYSGDYSGTTHGFTGGKIVATSLTPVTPVHVSLRVKPSV